MVELRHLFKLVSVTIFLFSSLLLSFQAMSYEEPKYTIIKETDVYEVRYYAERTVAQLNYGEEDNAFRTLFKYISGENKASKEVKMTIPVTQSVKIQMTVPVTQAKSDGNMVMQFFLPEEYSKKSAPKPTNQRIQIIDLPQTHFAVISYSGFASNSNFEKHHSKLKSALDNDGFNIIGPPIKATYNSPFTLPFLRRNEAMFAIKWE